MGDPHASPSPMTDGSKNLMSNMVNIWRPGLFGLFTQVDFGLLTIQNFFVYDGK